MTLTDQRIVIIGGSSGMGLATARAAAAAGAAVTIASRDKERLDTALAGLPGNCDGAVVDTASEMENGFVTGTVLTVDGGFILTGN